MSKEIPNNFIPAGDQNVSDPQFNTQNHDGEMSTNIIPIFKHLTPRKHQVVVVIDKYGRVEDIYVDNVLNYQVTVIDNENNEYIREWNTADLNEMHKDEGAGFRVF